MATKLLLVEDVEDLGRVGDVVNVKPGYARNFLLPRGLAVVANKNALRMQQRLQEERRQKAAQDRKEAEQQAGVIEGVTLTSVVKVDHEGHMYGSVNAADIVGLLQDQASLQVEKRSIQLKQPIKETGVHTINVKLKEGVTAAFTLKIISEEANAAAPAEAKEE